ncbi:hypothetical protein ACPCSE_29365 [Streptomyces cellulosae]
MTAQTSIPLGHTIPAHRAFGWCSHCPDRSVAEELAAWQTRELIDNPAAVSAAVAPPTDQAADEAALAPLKARASELEARRLAEHCAVVLRWAADHLDNSERLRDLTDDHMDDINAAANELRRMADETATETPSMRLARQSVQAMTDTLQRVCPPGCATDESHDPGPAAGARQDEDR